METIPKNNCQKIGFIQKPHGIHGELVIRFQEEFYDSIEEQPTLFFEIDNLLVPFFISKDGLRFKSGESIIVKLNWIDSEIKAKELCGSAVFIDNDDLVESDEELSPNALVGYTLFGEEIGLIGQITELNDFSGNILLTVDYNGKEVMIPLNEDLIVRLDEENREIELIIADGLLDLDEE